MAVQGGIRRECRSHNLMDVEEVMRIARSTGDKGKLEKAMRYRQQGRSAIDYCNGREITTCEGCKDYQKMD